MDERARATLTVIQGRCAGKSGNCHRHDLVTEGLCPECVVEAVTDTYIRCKTSLEELAFRFPQLAIRDPQIRKSLAFTRDPFKDFGADLYELQLRLRRAQVEDFALNAEHFMAKITHWEAQWLVERSEYLSGRLHWALPQSEQIVQKARELLKDGFDRNASELARIAIDNFESRLPIQADLNRNLDMLHRTPTRQQIEAVPTQTEAAAS